MKRIAATNIARQERLRPWQMTAAAAIALLLLPGLRVSHDNHVAFDHATLTSLGIHR